jgi:phage-related minor tail protein|nr:MAG TPA: minor tail protein [Caudoviricetes sp.]
MAVTYKGLTIKFGGDTTELQGALKKVQGTAKDTQGALKDINRALKLDPGNTELLTEKAKLLNRAYDETKTKLDAYKSALSTLEEKQRSGVALTEREQAQYSSLKAQVAICESQLESYADDLKNVSREAEASKTGLYQFGQTVQDNSDKLAKAGKGLETAGKTITGAVGGAATALVGLASSQEENIEQTHQLDAAWKDAGGTSEQARNSYTLFYKLLGEEDTATEAAQNLSRLTTNQQELDKWNNIAAGSFSKFGDALPLENLVEASQETAHTGTVTGGLADALNWATASNEQWSAALSGNQAAQQAFNDAIGQGATKEDAFNAALAACGSEQERSSLITQTLDGLYGEIGQTYQDNNKTMLDSREQQAQFNQKLTEAGEAALPVKEKVLELGTTLLEKVTPALESVSDWFQQLSPEQQDLVTNIALGTLAFGSLATGAGKVLQAGSEIGGTIKTVSEKFGGLKGAIGAVGGGWTSFTGLIAANPILLGVAAVAAAVAGLTWFFTQTETGKQMWSDFTGWISEKWQGVQDFFAGVPVFWQGIWDGITGKAEEVKNDLGAKFDGIKEGASNAWENLKTNASDAWGNLQSAASEKFGAIKDSIRNDMQTGLEAGSSSAKALQAAMNGDWSTAKTEAANAFNLIKDNITNKLGNAKTNAINIADTIGDKLGFPGLGTKVDGVFEGIKNGITNKLNSAWNTISWIPNQISSAFSGIRISLPHISLPHFSVSWRDIGGIVDLPSISVSWYAKGGYFDRPSIIGVGEAGGEHVTPDRKLRESVEDAVSRAFDRWGGGANPVSVSVTVNATVNDKVDAYTTGQQIGAGIASRLKQRGVTVGA